MSNFDSAATINLIFHDWEAAQSFADTIPYGRRVANVKAEAWQVGQ
tara:strand:- start:1107 stop:1244 length:138 start_codon:yes stop_codon:yes gene_type:complete